MLVNSFRLIANIFISTNCLIFNNLTSILDTNIRLAFQVSKSKLLIVFIQTHIFNKQVFVNKWFLNLWTDYSCQNSQKFPTSIIFESIKMLSIELGIWKIKRKSKDGMIETLKEVLLILSKLLVMAKPFRFSNLIKLSLLSLG